jgi:hypothetical protein
MPYIFKRQRPSIFPLQSHDTEDFWDIVAGNQGREQRIFAAARSQKSMP